MCGQFFLVFFYLLLIFPIYTKEETIVGGKIILIYLFLKHNFSFYYEGQSKRLMIEQYTESHLFVLRSNKLKDASLSDYYAEVLLQRKKN